MLRKAVMSILVLIALSSLAHAESSLNVNEGEWEITMNVEIAGMPMKMPPNTFTQCIKKDQAIPKDQNPAQQCVTKDVVTKGNSVSWSMLCTNAGGQMTGKGKVAYEKDKMDGSMTMQGQGMKMVSHFKGHRIGACH